jgi:CheY-like chemotaxis protein
MSDQPFPDLLPTGSRARDDEGGHQATGIRVPPEIACLLSGKRFALLGFAAAEVTRIIPALESVGAFARAVEGLPGQFRPGLLAPFDIFLIRAPSPAMEYFNSSAGQRELAGKPVLVIGSRQELLSHSAVFAAGTDCLLEPWVPEDLLLRSFRAFAKSSGPDAPPAAAENAAVMVAEDDATTAAMVSTVLRNYGLPCETARDGAEAMESARRLHPSLVVLDINMPKFNGFEVLATLKNDPGTRAMRVIMLTSCHNEADIIRAFGLGADDYIVKPFNPLELVARVRRLLRTRP